MGAIAIPASVRSRILAHARRAAPDECCGLLVGRGGAVFAAMPVENVASRRRVRFEVDPHAHIALRRVLRDTSPALTIVGAYHSHPLGPPRPSASDLADAHYPEWVHLVVGRNGRRACVRAFTIDRGVPIPLTIRTA